MIIIGIDPGIATTGFGVIEKKGHKLTALSWGAILTKAHTPLEDRLAILHDDLQLIISKCKPDAMAVEDLFFNTNAKTALIVGQARGVVLLTGKRQNLSIHHYTPPQVKLAVSGYGGATKSQVQYMVTNLLNLPETPKPDDVADALAIAICHANTYQVQSHYDLLTQRNA